MNPEYQNFYRSFEKRDIIASIHLVPHHCPLCITGIIKHKEINMRFCYVIIVSFLFIHLVAQTNIAVIDFTNINVLSGDTKALTDRLRTELFSTGKFQVIERDKMENILREQSFQISGCTSDACAIEAGQLLNVEQIIAGSISRVGSIFSISARVIDVEKGNIIKTATYDYQGQIEDLLKTGMKNIAYQLAGLKLIQQKETLITHFPDYTRSTSSSNYRYNNFFYINKKIGCYGLWTTYGITILGTLVLSTDANAGVLMTFIPVIGPFLAIEVIERRPDLYFIDDGKKLLKSAGYVQSGFALYYLLSEVCYEIWRPSKRLSILPNNSFSGLNLSYYF